MTENKEKKFLISRSSITLLDKAIIAFLIIFGIVIATVIGCLYYPDLPDSIIEVIAFISLMFLTTIFHEWIHAALFKLYGRGTAKIRVLRDKKLRAIMIYQENHNIQYTKKETFITLLAPFITITILSLPLINIATISWLIKTNMILNGIGSALDIALVLKIQREHPNVSKVQYSYKEGIGVIMELTTN